MGRSSAIFWGLASRMIDYSNVLGERRWRTALLAVSLLVGGVAHAGDAKPMKAAPQEEIPDLRFSITSLLAGRVNPLGLEEALRAGLQKKLYHHDALALRDNFIFIGANPKFNPAYLRAGPSIEIQP